MRKALVVGIDHYVHYPDLCGCVADAESVRRVLARHGNDEPNFGVEMLTARGDEQTVLKGDLKDKIEELFAGDNDIALFYFAGHGYSDQAGGYILASDSARGDQGVPLSAVAAFANKSRARSKVIVLDSCQADIAGDSLSFSKIAELAEGLTILTASTKGQYASEEDGYGLFTSLFVDALEGAAANLVGAITPGSAYAHIDQSLGPWEQRPVFKTNVKNFISLRNVDPPVAPKDLRRIRDLFPHPAYEFHLDPSYEPESENPDPENTKKFAVLQKYNRVNLLVPIGAEHMWHAAMQSKSCRLTALGEHYRRLVVKGRI